VFQRIVKISEKVYNDPKSHSYNETNYFAWKNNMLKYYLEFNVEKAVTYGLEVKDEFATKLKSENLDDLDFSIAVCF
jgi:hypothetical protein